MSDCTDLTMDTNEENAGLGQWWTFAPLRNSLIAAVVALSGLTFGAAGLGGEALALPIYLIAILIGWYYWLLRGIHELLVERMIGIDMLMLAAVIPAVALGMSGEAAAFVVLYAAAVGVEDYAYARTRLSIRALLDLVPKQARLLRGARKVLVPVERLRRGDRFLVRPGESVATDGVVIKERSSINESLVTGESALVSKKQGDPVLAGTLNSAGVLTVRATSRISNNTLSRIIHFVEEAQDQKGRSQKLIERFCRRYIPAVLVAALLLFVVAWLLGYAPSEWGHRAVVLLVAAAPCALVISLPIAMAAGMTGAGRNAILIKGGAHLEHLGVIRTIAFDKTGTVTCGRLGVTDVIAPGTSESSLLAVAAALERESDHPIGSAVVAAASERQVRAVEAIDFESLVGSGVRAAIDGEVWFVGSPALFRDNGCDLDSMHQAIEDLESSGKTVVVVGRENHVAGLIALQDTIRPEAASVVQELQQAGARLVLLTGDNLRAAERVAETLGIEDVRAHLKPKDKVAVIGELEREAPVLMVGDGVSDAPALASATCGIAMGTAGTEAALEAADIAVMPGDLRKLTQALHLGRRAREISRQNILLSLVVLAVLIPLAVSGLVGLAVAMIVHATSVLLAVANGMRVGRLTESTAHADATSSAKEAGA